MRYDYCIIAEFKKIFLVYNGFSVMVGHSHGERHVCWLCQSPVQCEEQTWMPQHIALIGRHISSAGYEGVML